MGKSMKLITDLVAKDEVAAFGKNMQAFLDSAQVLTPHPPSPLSPYQPKPFLDSAQVLPL